MNLYRLPNTDLEVSRLCFGTVHVGASLQGADLDRLVSAFMEAGGNFFDTAHCYAFWEPAGAGCSEREFGACLRRLGIRERVFIATKGGHPDGGSAYPRPAEWLSERRLTADVDESLDRMGIERVDLFYLHRDDGNTPVEEIIEALNAQIRRGCVRYLGASNWSVARIEAANAYAARQGLQGFVISQVQWSLATPKWKIGADPTLRYVTDEERVWHQETGLPIAAYTATAAGYFAGNTNGGSNYDTETNAARRKRAEELAHQLGVTPTQVALAWLLGQDIPTLPIFSTSNLDHLREILNSESLRLSAEQRRWLQEG